MNSHVKFSAQVFLFNPKANSVFLHLRDSNAQFYPNQWGLFGGSCEAGESPLTCAKREISEEVGVTFPDADFIPLRDYWNEDFNTHRYVFCIKSDLPKSAMKLGEVAGFDWVPLNELHQRDLTRRTVEDLNFFIEHLNQFQ